MSETNLTLECRTGEAIVIRKDGVRLATVRIGHVGPFSGKVDLTTTADEGVAVNREKVDRAKFNAPNRDPTQNRDQAHGLRAIAIADEAKRRADETHADGAHGVAEVDEAVDPQDEAEARQREAAQGFVSASGVPNHCFRPGPRPLRGNAAGHVLGGGL